MYPLLVLGLIEFVRGALILSLLPIYGKSVAGFSLSIIGTAISLHYLFDNVFRIPAGWLLDRYGGRWLTGIGIGVSALGLFMIYSTHTASLLMAGAILFGLGLSPVWPGVVCRIAAEMPTSQIGEALSTVFIAWLVGSGLGPIMINFFVGRAYGLAFVILISVLVLAMFLAFAVKIPRKDRGKGIPTKTFFIELYHELAALKILYPGMFVQTMSLGILMPIIAIYARTVFGLNSQQFSYLLIGGGAFTVLLLVPAGRMVDRIGVKRPLIAGFSICALSLGLLPFQKTVALSLVFVALAGVGYSLILPAWNGLMARVLSPEKRGTMWAIFMTIEGVGTAAGAFIGGKVWDAVGHQGPFLISAAILITMAVFYAQGKIDRVAAFSGKPAGH